MAEILIQKKGDRKNYDQAEVKTLCVQLIKIA